LSSIGSNKHLNQLKPLKTNTYKNIKTRKNLKKLKNTSEVESSYEPLAPSDAQVSLPAIVATRPRPPPAIKAEGKRARWDGEKALKK